MATSFGALCNDFSILQKLALKMDLPMRRETVLDLFDRVRRAMPTMEHFRRYQGELALESREDESRYSWASLRRTSIRSGWVNPESLAQAYRLHRLLLDTAPYFLSVSALDIDFLELVFGFDLKVEANRNEIVFDALLGESPLAGLVDRQRERLLDAQPFIGFALDESCQLQACIEVKSRTRAREVAQRDFADEPISIYLTVRRFGPWRALDDLGAALTELAAHAERLAAERLVPGILTPIRQLIYSRPE
jgi:hypothetical protein